MRSRETFWFLLHLATLAGSAVVLLQIHTRLWFFFDEWDFITHYLGDDPQRGLLQPHNEHWSTIPVLVYRVLGDTVGLRSYLSYAAVLIALHLALVHALWWVARRSGAGPAITTAACFIMALLGAGSQNILWAFQIGFIGSVLCAWVHALLVDHPGRFGGRDILGWVTGIAGLACSGLGVVLLLVPAVTAFFRRGLRAGLLTITVPAAAFLAWYSQYGVAPAEQYDKAPNLQLLPAYMIKGMNTAADTISGFSGTGLALAIVTAAALFAGLVPRAGQAPLVYGGLLTIVPFYAFVGLGRTVLGVEQAGRTRYVYVATALALPVIAVVLTRLCRGRPRWVPVALAVAGALVFGHNVALLYYGARHVEHSREILRQRVFAALSLVRNGEPIHASAVLSGDTLDLRFGDLARLDALGIFPPDPPIDPTAVAQMRLMGQVDLRLGPEPPGAACHKIEPSRTKTRVVAEAQPAPRQFSVRPSASGPVRLIWRSGDQPGSVQAARTQEVVAGRTYTVQLLAPTGQLLVDLPAAPVKVCGAPGG
jgi:hypothetical protein